MKKEFRELVLNVKDKISKGNTENAIKLLQEDMVPHKQLRSFHNELVIISNSFFEYKKKERLDTLPANDNSLPKINSSILQLVDEIEKIDFKKFNLDETTAESITREVILAKNSEELERIKFEAKKAKEKNPDDFKLHRAYKMLKRVFDWNDAPAGFGAPHEHTPSIKKKEYSPTFWIAILIILLAIIYGIFQLA